MENHLKKILVFVHSHIDVEWYWTVETTLEWTKEILDSAVALLKLDPDYRFAQDQTFLIKSYYDSLEPAEQENFRRFVKEGRFDVVGGMYVQPEVAEPHGECLIRQISTGQAWLQATFGSRCRIGWLIDTFGQIPQIPQILSRSGYTHIVFWRDISPEVDFDSMPADFFWRSPDGTNLRAHWLPGGYSVRPAQVKLAMDHHATHHVLLPQGDDVVRPNQNTAEIRLEIGDKLEKLGYPFGEIRIVSPSEFFAAVDTEGYEFPVLDYDFNPPFYGQDLRGTYDNRIKQKQRNRAAEASLLSAECLASLSTLKGLPYPKETLEALWEKVLFSQFHDTVACSSSDPVYLGVMARLGTVLETSQKMTSNALEMLSSASGEKGNQVVVFNPLSFTRSVICRIPMPAGDAITDENGESLPVSLRTDAFGNPEAEFEAKDLPALGFKVYTLGPIGQPSPSAPIQRIETTIENEFYRLRWDGKNGDLTSIWDKKQAREVLAAPGNAIVAMREKNPDMEGNIYLTGEEIRSNSFDAAQIEIIADAIGERVRITSPFQDCQLIRTVNLYHGSQRIDFETALIDFQGGDVMVKASFPLNLDWSGLRPLYETAFAATSRPSGHYAAQTWVDCSDSHYGAALFNQGTPGYWVGDGCLELTLLRSFANYTSYQRGGLEKGVPGYATSTQTELAREHGDHTFRYSLYPHAHLENTGELFQIGQSLNFPPIILPGISTCEKSSESIIACGPNFSMTALKQAEDGSGLVFRGFETAGQAHEVSLTISPSIRSISRCDLTETPLESLAIASGKSTFSCAPYEIVTLRLEI